MKTKLRSLFVATAALFAVGSSGMASAVDPFILPTPENNTNAIYGTATDATGATRAAIIMDGIPIAFKYDDFWSYSSPLLKSIQTNNSSLIPTATFGTYNFSTGTGTIDINVTSVAGGASNEVGTLTFQDPVNLSSSQQVEGWQCGWGGNTQYCDITGAGGTYSDPAARQGGTTTVGNLLTYLQGIDPTWKIPLFYADYNQTGSGDSLWMSAMVEIWNPTMTTRNGFWQLDAATNDTWDVKSPTFNFGSVSFLGDSTDCAADPWDPLNQGGCAGATTSGIDYDSLDHNLGSGRADFMVFAPDMNLSLFNADDLFVVTINLGCTPNGVGPLLETEDLGCNTNGGEEFGILGGVAPTTSVPEPGSLALLGLGLAGLGMIRRRRHA